MNEDILFFFEEHMDALPMYEKPESWMLSQIPNVNIKVAKTQITFSNKRGFAMVVRMKMYIRRHVLYRNESGGECLVR